MTKKKKKITSFRKLINKYFLQFQRTQTHFRNLWKSIFTKKINKQLIKTARRLRINFRTISAIDKKSIEPIQFNLNHYFAQISYVRLWRKKIWDAIFYPYFLLSLTVIIILPFWGEFSDLSKIEPKPIPLTTTLTILSTTLSTMLLFFIFMLFLRLIVFSFPTIPYLAKIFTTITVQLILYSWVNNHPVSVAIGSVELEVPSLAVVYNIAYMIILLIVIVFRELNYYVFNKLLMANHPDAFIAYEVIMILNRLDKKTRRWLDIDNRRDLLNSFEGIASCIENQLYKKLFPNDPATDNWFQKSTKEMATAIRAKKMMVLAPTADSQEILTRFFSSMLITIGKGNWNEVEKIEPVQISSRVAWRERISGLLSALVTGSAPLLLIYFIQKTNLALDTPLLDYVTGGAIIWALFTLITAFDPSFNLKFEAMKNVAGIFPFGGKK